MKIYDRRKRNYNAGIITCNYCKAVLEVKPSECTRETNELSDFRFWVECPCCETNIPCHAKDVRPSFWMRVKEWNCCYKFRV